MKCEFKGGLTAPLLDPFRLWRALARPAQYRPPLLLCDVRWYLDPRKRGIEAYRRAHLPGALFVDLDRDLCGPLTRRSGRHPWPTPQRAAERLSRLGITRQHFVVGYDDAGGAVAARLWLVLRWLGHTRAAVLDGGLPRWRALGLPTESAPRIAVPGKLVPDPRGRLLASKTEVRAAALQGRVADARAPERYRGALEPIDARPGHVPGAANLPFAENLSAHGVFKDARALAARFSPGTIHYCGSGVTACHNVLAQELAGVPGARLYPGSWSEWARDEMLPAKTGEE